MRHPARAALATFFALAVILIGLPRAAAAQSTIASLTLSNDTTFTAANGPYTVTGHITVVDTVVMTVEAGAVFRFGNSGGLDVRGALVAVGTQEAPIVFSTDQLNPLDGFWDGILIDGFRSAGLQRAGLQSRTRLEWCDIGFGSGTGIGSISALVLIRGNASPIIANSTIHDARSHGLIVNSRYIRDENATVPGGPEIRNNLFRNNGFYGLRLGGSAARHLDHVDGDEFDLAQEVPRLITGNRFEGNGQAANTDLDAISLGQVRIPYSYTWSRIDSQRVDVDGNVEVARFGRDGAPVTLTVPAGTRIRVASGEIQFWGGLSAMGTEDQPIEFVGRDGRRGQWAGLIFDQVGAVGHLEHARIEDANTGLTILRTAPVTVRNTRIGQTTSIAIHIDGAEPTIEASELVNEGGGTGIRVSDARQMPTLTDNVIRGFADPLVIGESSSSGQHRRLNPAHLQRITGTSLQENAKDAIILDNLDFWGDYTWGAVDGMEVLLRSEIGLRSGATLTVPAGERLRFMNGGWLRVRGTLNAIGTQAAPIHFTNESENATSGRWSGVVFEGRQTSGSRVEWCVFSHGGHSTRGDTGPSGFPRRDGLVEAWDAAPTFVNSIFQSSTSAGLVIDSQYDVDNAEFNGPTVTACTFRDNATHGLVLRATLRSQRVDLVDVVPAAIQGNTYENNGDGNLRSDNSIALGDLVLARSYMWGQIDGQDPDVMGHVVVAATDRSGQPLKLTIQAGERIEFGYDPNGNTNGSIVVQGEFEAIGTEATPIVFTAINEDAALRSSARSEVKWPWDGLRFEGNRAVGRIEHSGIRHARNAAIHVGDDADVTVRHTKMQRSWSGLWTDAAAPLLEDCTVTHTSPHGIVINDAALMPTLTRTTLSDLGGEAIVIDGGLLDPSSLRRIQGTHVDEPEQRRLQLQNVVFDADYEWIETIDSLRVVLAQSVTFPRQRTLIVPAGSTVPFVDGGTLKILGTLHAVGTQVAPIHFTTANFPDPNSGETRGSWGGVAIDGRGSLAQRGSGEMSESRIEWSTFSHGRGSISFERSGSFVTKSTILLVNQASPLIRNCVFSDITKTGLYVLGLLTQGNTQSTAMPRIEGSRFLGNEYGLEAESSLPTLVGNSFVGQQRDGVRNITSSVTVDATGSWWGSSTGPTHSNNTDGSGDRVSANVDFADWLQAAPGPLPPQRPDVTGLVGDVDGNGHVSIRDALIVAAYVLDATVLLPSGADISRGDANGDGRVSLRDALIIATYVVNPDNENLPPFIAARPVPLALGALQSGERVTIHLEPDTETQAYELQMSWDVRDLRLLSAGTPVAMNNQPGSLAIVDLALGADGTALPVRELVFEALREATVAVQAQHEALTADLREASLQLRVVSLPQAFDLALNYPNPFNPSTTIRYDLAAESPVRLVIYNIAGQQVRTLVSQKQVGGRYEMAWDGHDDLGRAVGAGVYLYTLEAGDRRFVRKMLLLE